MWTHRHAAERTSDRIEGVLVRPMVRQRSRNGQAGYLAAALGGAAGALGLMFLGFHLGLAYVRIFMPNAELEGVIPPFLGVSAGWCIGEVLGCWVSLHWQRCWGASQTSRYLALLTPIGFFMYILTLSIISGIGGMTSHLIRLVVLLVIGITAITLPLLARFWTIGCRRVH
jgi:hypothetical protein